MSKKILFSLSFLIAFIALPTLVGAAFEYTPMETIPGFEKNGNFCEYIKQVYNFGLWVIGICAMFMIMIGGYMYLVSAGNNASMTKAKGIIFDAIIGLLLAFSAYLILYVINPELVQIKGICDGAASGNQPAVNGGAQPAANGGVQPSATTGNTPIEDAARAELAAANIDINRPTACAAGQTTGCTNVAGLQDTTKQGVIALQEACTATLQPGNEGCPITITGGSEGGHSNKTPYSHATGYKVDLQQNSVTTNFIEKTYGPSTKTRTEKDGRITPLYYDSKGNEYAKEASTTTGGAHWDVCYNCQK